MDDNYSVKFDFYLDVNKYLAKAFIPYPDNKCCEKPFFILTKSRNYNAYSCQCACGMWCTNGHPNPHAAIDEYVEMCNRAKNNKKGE